ncbi:MAG: heme exporter protein CcmB [Planctomycetota bacterium]
MSLFFKLLRWDFIREMRRKESLLNMILFAILTLFLIQMGAGPLFARLRGIPGDDFFITMTSKLGAVYFWVTVLFSGTVGLNQSFASEREGAAIDGIALSPIDLGIFYLAKVVATWVYVMAMELCLLGGFLILFSHTPAKNLGGLVACLGVFTLGYVALGVTFAAMTSILRGGGEVVLRILLFPLLMPMVYLTLGVPEANFGTSVTTPPTPLGQYLALLGAFDVIYLTSGFLLFPKIFDE